MLLSKAKDMFILDREAKGLAHNTIKFYKYGISKLCQHAEHLEDVSPHSIRQTLRSMQKDKYAQNTIYGVYRSIHCFLNWLAVETEDDSYKRIIDKVSSPRQNHEKLDAIPLETVEKLLDSIEKPTQNPLSGRDKAIISLLIDSGLRANELLSLNVSDINLDTGAINVQTTKNGKPRIALIGVETRKAIQSYLSWHREDEDNAPLFTTTYGDRLSYSALRRMLRVRSKHAEIKYYGAHSYRRAWATISLRNGVNIEAVRTLGGWSSVDAMQPYLDLAERDLIQAYHSPLTGE